jgi:hypothetical protein
LFTVQLGDLDLSSVDEHGVLWGVELVDGWGSTGSTASQTQRPRQSGAWAGGKFAKPRDVSVEGTFRAPTPELAQDASDRLLAAVDREETPLHVAETGPSRWTPVFQTGETLVTWESELEATWSFQVASDDWRKFGPELTASTELPSTTGGLVIPPGGLTGPVRLRIEGPVVGPVVTHVSTGAQLVFASSLALGEGEWVDVDMEARTVLANGQASRNGWITSRGWSAFDPGVNSWAFTATSYNPAARLTVTAVPSWK